MKKIISLVICVILALGMLAGCNMVQRDYERDYGQVIVTISPISTTRTEIRVKRDQNGMPVKDVDGETVMESSDKTQYTSPEVKIYKSQLVNYVNYYLSSELSNSTETDKNKAIEDTIEKFMEVLISTELLTAEADRLFDAGVLYWTVDDINEIQRSVYSTIDEQILTYKNQLLAKKGLSELAAITPDTEEKSTTYPLYPDPNASEEKVSPEYKQNDTGEYQWFDSWYTDTDNAWYIQDSKYSNNYPGLFGDAESRSLAMSAFTLYLDTMIENSKNIIGITSEQEKEIKQNIEDINRIRNSKGVEYVYPMIGKTLMFKLLVGNSSIKNKKLTKLEDYRTKDVTVTVTDVEIYYDKQLKTQKSNYVTQAKYDSAVSGGDTILYAPSDRYLYVKHILLPFSEDQKAELNKIKTKYGADTATETAKANVSDERMALILEERAALARKIIVYPHVDGEDDKSNPKSVKTVTQEITTVMNRYINNAYEAERAFDKLIYKYNTDPGIFGNEKGYSVVYDPGTTESGYMQEFADAAMAFRKDGYKIGQIYYDGDLVDESGNPVPYTITDYGIHVMYYCVDPAAGEVKGLNDYVTAGRYTKIYDLMKDAALAEARLDAYSRWEKRYVGDNKEDYSVTKQKLVDKYVKEVIEVIYG